MVSSSSIFVSTAALVAAVALSSNAAPLQKRASAKRGVAWNFAETVNADIFSQGSSWTYSYEHFQPGGAVGNGMEFVIMQRTAGDTGDSAISKLAADAAGSSWVMGFNEGDNPADDGSNLTPQAAAGLWKQYFNPLGAQGKKLVAPSITSSTEAGKGFDWLDQFMSACDGCQIDALAYHPYAPDAATINGLIDSAVSNFGSKYPGKEIWITEFGRDINNVGQPGGAQMLTDVINKLESTPQVSRYAYIAKIYGSFEPERDLQTDEGSTSMTSLGQIYNQ